MSLKNLICLTFMILLTLYSYDSIPPTLTPSKQERFYGKPKPPKMGSFGQLRLNGVTLMGQFNYKHLVTIPMHGVRNGREFFLLIIL